MSKSFDITQHRPRLEPGPGPGVGPGPLSPYWRRAPEPQRSIHPVAVLHGELDAFRQNCLAAIRRANNGEGGVSPIARNEVDWLNERLGEVQRLNAGLFHNVRSSAIAGWPAPPLPTNVLFGPRELLSPLGDALQALASVAQHGGVTLDD